MQMACSRAPFPTGRTTQSRHWPTRPNDELSNTVTASFTKNMAEKTPSIMTRPSGRTDDRASVIGLGNGRLVGNRAIYALALLLIRGRRGKWDESADEYC